MTNSPLINILLAEDDLDDRLLFTNALSELPIKTNLKIMQDGVELMNYCFMSTTILPDIIFLDLSMPKKTGFECLIELKEDAKLKFIPVVILTTSYGSDLIAEKAMIKTLLNIGTIEYIKKPSNYEQLKQILYQTLMKLAKMN